MKKTRWGTILSLLIIVSSYVVADDFSGEWNIPENETGGCLLVSVVEPAEVNITRQDASETIPLTSGHHISPLCHSGTGIQPFSLTTSGSILYVDFSGSQITSFSGGSLPHLIYLSLTGNAFSTEAYNAFLSEWSQQTFTGGDKYLIASPAQYGGCNLANREAGITGHNKLTDEKGRTIIDGGLADCASEPSAPTIPSPSGGGGGTLLKIDNCPDGDWSPSYYDGECGIPESGISENYPENSGEFPSTDNSLEFSENNSPKFSNEIITAYQRAYAHGITTLQPLENAAPDGPVLRSHMAKMIVNYAIPLYHLSPDASQQCFFNDIAEESEELQSYITLACQLGIMGIAMENDHFLPNKILSRAEFGMILSRLLRGATYNGGIPYYINHLQALQEKGIMTQIANPTAQPELRQWVRVMLMRSAK